jgi:protein arginine kinase activator
MSCPTCGATLSEFQESGRLGCPSCYQVFTDELNALFTRIHGSTEHGGKHPGGGGDYGSETVSIEVLKRKLKTAVESEEFEEAALLRDKIHEAELVTATGRREE